MSSTNQPDRPNILFLQFDQLKAAGCSVHGDPASPTDFLKRMAAEGVSFRNAFAPSPICTPSRASVMTGVHPLVHQVTCHQNRAPMNLAQLPELLAAEDYFNAVVGHYEADRSLTRGWHEQVGNREPRLLEAAVRHWYAHGRTDVAWSSGTLEGSPEEGHAYRLTQRTLPILDGIAHIGKPFFLHVPYLEPHPPYFIYRPYDTLVDPASVMLPDPGIAEGRPAWLETLREQSGSALASEADMRAMLAVYYGMAGYADDQMERLCREMDSRGMLDDTWIIIASDHGDFAGEKGLAMKCECLYECLLHVPLVIVPPRRYEWPRGVTVDGLVDLTDLFPTILTMAQAPVPDYTQGHDLVSWVGYGTERPLRDAVFSQVGGYRGSLGTTFPSGMAQVGRHPGIVRGGRNLEATYIRDPDYGDEAYDLRDDPRELVNLLGNGRDTLPQPAAEVRSLVDAWDKECRELREELGVIPGYRGFDGE